MAKFKIGDKVRMDPFISGDHDQYVKFRNKIGTIVGVGTYEYDVTFPENPGEAYEFYEEELTRVKSLPTTATKGTARFKIGDKVLVLPGNYRSGKVGTVVAFQDGDPAVQLEGLPEPELFAEYELRLEKSLPTTDTKALLREKYKSFVPTDGQTGWVIWDGESYWSPSGWVEEGSDKARYFRSRASAQEVCDHLRRKGKIGRSAQVIDVKG